MYLLGHTDPMLTMRVYQHVLDMGGGAVQAFERVLGSSGCSAAASMRPWPRIPDAGVCVPNGHPARKSTSSTGASRGAKTPFEAL
jgi:hypothetical protein